MSYEAICLINVKSKREREKQKREEWYEEEWQGMPEFVQRDLTPLKTIYVHFSDEEDIGEFAKLVEQNLTIATKSIWFPKRNLEPIKDERYVDESALSHLRNIKR